MEITLPGYNNYHLLYESANTIIYRSTREQDKQSVILKMLKPEHPQPEEPTRYMQEYEITSHLDVPGVIKAYGLESYQDSLILVLEDFGNTSLKNLLDKSKMANTSVFSIQQFLKIARQIVAAIGQIHAAGITHKNINPSNILIDFKKGEVKLIDFGLATTLKQETPTIKSPQVLEGTLEYISPEQTGRMNRTVDYRTDYYSLGVTFYELLTGRLPYEAADAMEMVHSHLAKIPVAPHVLNPDIPHIVSEFVLKLMAKAPEDRYQSARGIEHDLDMFSQHWKAKELIPDFELGKQDRAEQFIIQEKLYGRSAEIEILLSAFERVAKGHTELMLVTGLSGIGKTAVINQVHKPITRQRGYFIQGKFEQLNRNIPFMALVQALRDLMVQLLSESQSQQKEWQSKIVSVLGENGKVIIDVIPELEKIIGSQPEVPELTGSAAQSRFNMLFQKFMAIFTKPEHPLVIFLDDLQWADWASLKLIQLLTDKTQSGYLLLLGAYRDNEVSLTHPLMSTINEIKKTGVSVNILTLNPLQFDDINQLVTDTLDCSPQLAIPLTQLIYQRTKGNPFFCHQFLKALYAERLITFNDEMGYWQCDLIKVSTLILTEDVVEFMASQILKLPPATQEVLKLAACIGNQFDLETLSIVYQKSPMETGEDLWPALQEGLVLPQNEIYKFFRTIGQETITLSQVPYLLVPRYRFLHDRVQQATYSLIPEAKKRSIHLNIGQLLLDNIPEEKQEEKIFEIVHQLNRGIELLVKPEEKQELAKLNLIAGRKARAATAFQASLDYFTVGRQLLPENHWKIQYHNALSLYESCMESAYLSGQFEIMQELADVILAKAQTLLDTIKVYEVRIEALTAQNQLIEAVSTGLRVLELFNVKFPEKVNQNNIVKALQETHQICQEKGIDKLINLPLMTDPLQLATMRILASILACAFLSNPELYTLLVLKQVDLSVKYGNTPASAFCYASYGLVLSGVVEDIETGSQFGQLALDLMNHLDARVWQCKVISVVHTFVLHWKRHVRDMLAPLRSAYYSGLETGDFQFAGYSAILSCAYAYYPGIEKELSELRKEVFALSEAAYHYKQITVVQYFQMLQQAIHDVIEGRNTSLYLQGEYYDEVKMFPIHLKANDRNGLFYLFSHKLLLSYLFEDYRQAVEDATQVEKYIDGGTGFPYLPIYYFYDSLARLAAYHDTGAGDQEKLLLRVKLNQEKMEKWAQYAPMNCLYKYELVEAEQQRVFGEKWKAIEYYDRAIKGAKENGYYRDEALANELMGKLFLEWGKDKVAQIYLQESHSGYIRWGAAAKASQLENLYPEILSPILAQARHPGILGEPLDLITVTKALHAIAGELKLEPLLKKMMRISLENAGAQRGALILERNGNWVIEAQGDVDNEIIIMQSLLLKDSTTLSTEIVYSVARTHTGIVLDDAACTGEFTHDNYIVQERVKSVMCTPLINQGRLNGIMYLENNLITQAFTTKQLELINLLSTQMALSLDNARLYQQAQEEITERKLAEIALKRSEQRLSLIVQQSPLAIIEWDRNFKVVLWNPAAEKIFGYTRDEAMSRHASLIIPEKTQPLIDDVWQALLEQRGGLYSNNENLTKDGRLITCEWFNAPLINTEGCIVGLASLVQDITERKQAEEEIKELNKNLEKKVDERTIKLNEAIKDLEAFAYSVSHDLRAPVRHIDGFLKLMFSKIKKPEESILDYYHKIQEATQRMSVMIDSLLSFSRLGRKELTITEIHLRVLVEEVINQFKPDIGKRNVKWIISDLPTIQGDKNLIKLVLENLISNAIKYTSKRKEAIIEIGLGAGTENLHEFYIKDNGIGFDMAYSEKLFGVFQRLHTSEDFEGVGIGLANVKQIIEKHKGYVRAEGIINKEAVFYFMLPKT